MDEEEGDIAEVEKRRAEEVKGGVASDFHDDNDDVDNCSVFTRAAANDDGVFVPVSFISGEAWPQGRRVEIPSPGLGFMVVADFTNLILTHVQTSKTCYRKTDLQQNRRFATTMNPDPAACINTYILPSRALDRSPIHALGCSI